MKKIVIVHDYIKEYGGAEKVLLTLHEAFPDAPIFTLIYAPQFLGPHQSEFKDLKIISSFLNKLPFSYKFISIYRLIAPFIFKSFNFSKFNIILTSATGAYSPNFLDKKNAKLISYYHTPPRYLYGFATARKQSNNLAIKFLVLLMLHVLRMIDFKSSQNVDIVIANSQNTALRIKKFYKKNAIVIYPPVNITTNLKTKKKNQYFLTGGRLARPKHIDLIVKTCIKLNLPLKIFGRSFAGYENEFNISNSSLEKNIQFLGEITDIEKFNLMKNAKAFIFAAEDEDFGIIPVEAMATGTPVIAYKSGGVLETVISKKTGIFFENLTIESLTEAIKKFEEIKFEKNALIKQAEKFSKENFIRNIKKVILT